MKVALVAADGAIRGSAAAYPTERIGDPRSRAASGGLVVRPDQATAGSTDADVAAICVVGQGPTMVPVDKRGKATHPAMTWLDGRPAAEAPELELATGLAGWNLGILPAARWLERHDPAAAARTRWYLNTWEWAGSRLTDVAVTTRGLGQILPGRDRLAGTGLAVERLPPVVDTGVVVGGLTSFAATELGMPKGIPVVAGTNDAFASFLGAGLLQRGDAIDTGGTSGGLAVYWDAPVHVPGSWVAPAPLWDRWIVGGAMTATGRALDWLADDVLGGVPVETLLAEAAAIPPGCDGLVFLPYLAGERSPLWDPDARGAFVGLTLAHGRGHLSRAVLEAAAYALRHVARPIRAGRTRDRSPRRDRRDRRSELWNRIKADVLGVPVIVPATANGPPRARCSGRSRSASIPACRPRSGRWSGSTIGSIRRHEVGVRRVVRRLRRPVAEDRPDRPSPRHGGRRGLSQRSSAASPQVGSPPGGSRDPRAGLGGPSGQGEIPDRW
jgi:xylulokinase